MYWHTMTLSTLEAEDAEIMYVVDTSIYQHRDIFLPERAPFVDSLASQSSLTLTLFR